MLLDCDICLYFLLLAEAVISLLSQEGQYCVSLL